MKYSKEQTIEDMKRCISEFNRKGLTLLANMKQKELDELLKK